MQHKALPAPTAPSFNTGEGGGFILDNADTAEGGGFLPDPTSVEAQPTAAPTSHLPSDPDHSSDEESNRLSIDLIPEALSRLDLPCDLEIIATFEHAVESDEDEEDEGGMSVDGRERMKRSYVTKEKFMAVCAVLMGGAGSSDENDDRPPESQDEEVDEEERVPPKRRRRGMKAVQEDDDGSDRDASIHGSDSEEEQVASPAERRLTRAAKRDLKGKGRAMDDEDGLSEVEVDEEEVIATTLSKKAKSKKANNNAGDRILNSDQQKVVSNMFAAFFEEDKRQDVDNKTIGLENIRYVAQLLNESLNDGDVCVTHSLIHVC